jgi:clathrin heavy chain
MNHCRTFISQLNTSKLIRYAELNHCWVEVVYLYSSTNQYDQAINIIIEHSPDAFTHEQFLNIITRVTNQKLLFRGILF